MRKKSVTAIIPLIGNHVEVQPVVTRLVSDLHLIAESKSTRLEYLFVGAGNHWAQVVDVAGLQTTAVARFLATDERSIPAVLFNIGAQHAQGEFLAFLWPGVDVAAWHLSLQSLAEAISGDDVALVGSPTISSYERDTSRSWLADPTDGNHRNYPPGWLEMADFAPMSNCLVRRASFIETGGFSTSPILQRAFWWEFSLHLSRNNLIRCTVTPAQQAPKWTWHEYPFAEELQVSGDLAARRVMLPRDATPKRILTRIDSGDVETFARHLPDRDAHVLARAVSAFDPDIVFPPVQHVANSGADALRVTVLGGPGEPAHNQLCFFNFFARSRLSTPMTWRTILDTAATRADLYGSDVVIFSRTKSQQACDLMDFCNHVGIPTIYMLDDNWFTVGKDWKEYAEVFQEDGEIFRTFTYCLRNADVALTYNKLLAEDMERYAKEVVILPTNIELSDFSPPARVPNTRAIVGYAGSTRPDNNAFNALKDLCKERDDFDVLYMGHVVPASLASIGEDRIKFEPYVYGYRAYAQMLSKHAPDILLAPLGATRFEASKCPNKFLEISAVGATGVYSKVEPYLSAVEDGRTGILVEDSKAAWKQAIERLVDSPEARNRIASAAKEELLKNYATEAVAQRFEAFIQQVAAKRKKSSGKARVAFVSHSSHPAGAERALSNFLRNIPKAIEPIAVFPALRGPIRDEVIDAGVPVIEANFKPYVPTKGTAHHAHLEEAMLRETTRKFASLFRELELDAVVVNTNVVPPAVFAGAQCEIPVILHSHGLISARLSHALDSARWGVEDARQLNAATAILCPSQIAADGYRALYNLPANKVAIVPNGTPCEPWKPLTEDGVRVRKFVMLCTMEPNKNISMFIEAASIYRAFGLGDVEFHLYGVGAAGHESYLRDLVWEKGLASVFHFHGKQSDVNSIYDDALAVVVTSHLESFSFVAIEGMSRGRPVIATKCGGPEGIISDGKTGYLIEQNDAAALAERMRRLSTDVAMAAAMGANARASIEKNFEIVGITERYAGVIKYVIDKYDAQSLRERRHSVLLDLADSRPAPVISTGTVSSSRETLVQRAVSLRHAGAIALHSRGLAQRIKNRLVVQQSVWDLVDPAFKELKTFCESRQWHRSRKLVLSRNLTDIPYAEYVVDAKDTPFHRVDIAVEIASPGMSGLLGIEIVDENQQIVLQTARQLADVDPFAPVSLQVGTETEPLKGVFSFRFFVMNAEGPVWIYELCQRRRFGLSSPSRLPFMAIA